MVVREQIPVMGKQPVDFWMPRMECSDRHVETDLQHVERRYPPGEWQRAELGVFKWKGKADLPRRGGESASCQLCSNVWTRSPGFVTNGHAVCNVLTRG